MSPEEDHSDDAALAGEYVLHLLDDAERVAFERRMADEPALRDLVREWDEKFSLMMQDIAPITPSAAVKTRLEDRLFADTPRSRSPWWNWLTGGVVAAGLAVGAVLLMPNLISGPDMAPTFTANIAAEDGSLIVTAHFTSGTNRLHLSRQIGDALPGHSFELWLIADGAEAPVSLGVLPEDREALIDLPSELATQMTNAVLAITDEPAGGSPSGAPTGPVVAAGPVTGA
ncbi:hypothetical protein HCZ87_08945 [Phaeobacter sp. HF9A]|nr:hypothetical protein [Phaeobacter sp. HF9A]